MSALITCEILGTLVGCANTRSTFSYRATVCRAAWAAVNPGSAELGDQISRDFRGSRKCSSTGFTGKTVIAHQRKKKKKSGQKPAVANISIRAWSYCLRLIAQSHGGVGDWGGGSLLPTFSTGAESVSQ